MRAVRYDKDRDASEASIGLTKSVTQSKHIEHTYNLIDSFGRALGGMLKEEIKNSA